MSYRAGLVFIITNSTFNKIWTQIERMRISEITLKNITFKKIAGTTITNG